MNLLLNKLLVYQPAKDKYIIFIASKKTVNGKNDFCGHKSQLKDIVCGAKLIITKIIVYFCLTRECQWKTY